MTRILAACGLLCITTALCPKSAAEWVVRDLEWGISFPNPPDSGLTTEWQPFSIGVSPASNTTTYHGTVWCSRKWDWVGAGFPPPMGITCSSSIDGHAFNEHNGSCGAVVSFPSLSDSTNNQNPFSHSASSSFQIGMSTPTIHSQLDVDITMGTLMGESYTVEAFCYLGN